MKKITPHLRYTAEAEEAAEDGEAIRHFWGDEMGMRSADPGQDPRGTPEPVPMWAIFDMTPEGRDPNWHPKLDYPR